MTTITPQHYPRPLHPTHRTKIPRHVARCLHNPETTITEVIHGQVEGSEGDPWAGEFRAGMGGVLGVEEAAVELGGWVEEVARGTGG